MEQDKNNIDDLFRNTLKDFGKEPPDSAWEYIKGRIGGRRLVVSPARKYINIAAIIFLLSFIFLTTYIYFRNTKTNTNTESYNHKTIINNSLTENNMPASASENPAPKAIDTPSFGVPSAKKLIAVDKPEQAETVIPEMKNLEMKLFPQAEMHELREADADVLKNIEENISEPQIIQPAVKDVVQLNEVNPEPADSKLSSEISGIIINPEPLVVEKNDQKVIVPVNSVAEESLQTVQTQPAAENREQFNINKDRVGNDIIINDTLKPKTNRIKPVIYLGLNYTPEYFISRSDIFSKGEDYTNSADMSLSLVFGDFQVRTGLGISFFNRDNWQYSVKYNSKDVIGTYDKVDSVTFTVTTDTITNSVSITPNFFTSKKTVYDYAEQLYKSEFRKTYTYLQVPVVVGYKLRSSGRFSLSLNGGTILSMLLASKANYMNYPVNANQILYVSNSELTRFRTYWNFLLNLGITYRISNRFLLNVEPSYKTIIGNFYRQNSAENSKPYSVGFRTGVLFKL